MDGQNSFVPSNIDHFFERAFLQMNLNNPEILTYMGFFEQAGIKNHNGYLQESPSDRHEELLKLSNEYMLTALHENRWETLTAEQKISRNVLKWTIENSNRTLRSHIYPMTQLDGAHTLFIMLMSYFAVIQNDSDVELYLNRLELAKMKFGLIALDIQKKRELGIMPPKICLEKVIRSMEGIIENLKTENNDLIAAVVQKYKAATGTDLPKQTVESIQAKIEQYVIPGYEGALTEIKKCIPHSTDDCGLWKLPRGEEFYRHCLKWQTSTDHTPQEVHDLGLRHCKNLLDRFQNVVKLLNDKGDMTLNANLSTEENLKILGENEKFLYEDSDESKDTCIKEYENLLLGISERVKDMFNIVPSSQCIIKPMPNAMGEGGAGACYFPGSLDLTRPGIFFVNLANIKAQNKSQMKTLTAHEAVPGHHFQISIQLENKRLPYFRRCCEDERFTAYIEGWGLYSEYIGKETGFYNEDDGSDGYSVLGYYCTELFRATRLVVDTGLHALRWTREQGIELMIRNTGMSRKEAEDEIDRYCVLPAQACSYKIGQLKLLEIRKKLEENPDFDIKHFHDTVLNIGAVPLDILEDIML